MRAAFIAVLIFLASPIESFAHGAIAVGLHPQYNQTEAVSSIDQFTEDEAINKALKKCTAARYINCSILTTFKNSCASFYFGYKTSTNYPATGATASEASASALAACSRENGACFPPLGTGVCDRTPATAPPVVPETTSAAPAASGELYALIIGGIAVLAISAAFLWAMVSAERQRIARQSAEAALAQPSPDLQPTPPRPRATLAQTVKAKEHLKNAHDICVAGEESWYKNKKFNFDDYFEALRTFGYAAEDVVKARDLDPDAEIVLKDKGQGVISITADTMAARLLFMEGSMSITPSLGEDTIRHGIQILQQHLVFRPYHAYAYALIAKAYTRVFERQNALDAIAKAIELDPNDLDVRKIRDDLLNPIIGTPKPKEHPMIALVLWSAAPLLVPIGIIMSIFMRGAEGLGIVIAVAGGVLWFVRNRRDNDDIYQKALGINQEEQTRTL